MEGSGVLEVVWIALHLVGLAGACLVRLEMSDSRQRWARGVFLACLALIAGAAVLGDYYCLALWPLSAGTLGIMVVTAVVDFRT
jgi:hypothetical protein